MRTKLWGMALALAVATWGSLALADHDPVHWAEVDDAGELPEGAQNPEGAGPLTSITGEISDSSDADMYGICVTGGGDFSATTVGTPGTVNDTQLFLFNAAGFGWYANDDLDTAAFVYRSLLPADHTLTPTEPGLYYLAITAWNRDPRSPGGLIFPNSPFSDVFGPTGPGGGEAITVWDGNNLETGTYTIALTGAAYLDLTTRGCPVK